MSENTNVALVRAYEAAREAQVAMATAKAAYDKAVQNLLAVGGDDRGKHSIPGGGSYTVSANNTYDEEHMRRVLTPGQLRRVSRSVLDKSVVKALYPDVHAGSKRENGIKVSLG